MSSNSILTQSNGNGNQTAAGAMAARFERAFIHTKIQPNTAYITAAVDLRATSGLVIPAGTYGRLLEINRHNTAFIDFGNQAVYAVPAGSPLISWNGGER